MRDQVRVAFTTCLAPAGQRFRRQATEIMGPEFVTAPSTSVKNLFPSYSPETFTSFRANLTTGLSSRFSSSSSWRMGVVKRVKRSQVWEKRTMVVEGGKSGGPGGKRASSSPLRTLYDEYTSSPANSKRTGRNSSRSFAPRTVRH